MEALEGFKSQSQPSKNNLKDDGLEEDSDDDAASIKIIFMKSIQEKAAGNKGSYHPELNVIMEQALYQMLKYAQKMGKVMILPFTEQGKLYALSIPVMLSQEQRLIAKAQESRRANKYQFKVQKWQKHYSDHWWEFNKIESSECCKAGDQVTLNYTSEIVEEKQIEYATVLASFQKAQDECNTHNCKLNSSIELAIYRIICSQGGILFKCLNFYHFQRVDVHVLCMIIMLILLAYLIWWDVARIYAALGYKGNSIKHNSLSHAIQVLIDFGVI